MSADIYPVNESTVLLKWSFEPSYMQIKPTLLSEMKIAFMARSITEALKPPQSMMCTGGQLSTNNCRFPHLLV